MVAQLVKWLLPTPEVRSTNPISDIYKRFSPNCSLEKTTVKEKMKRMAHLWKKHKSPKAGNRRVVVFTRKCLFDPRRQIKKFVWRRNRFSAPPQLLGLGSHCQGFSGFSGFQWPQLYHKRNEASKLKIWGRAFSGSDWAMMWRKALKNITDNFVAKQLTKT